MKCRKCGAEVSAEDKRCSQCGAPVLLRVMEQEEKEKRIKADSRSEKKEKTADIDNQQTMRMDTESFRAAAEKAERERINKNDDKENEKKGGVKKVVIGVIAAAAVFAAVSYAAFYMSSNGESDLAINSPSASPVITVEPSAAPEVTPEVTPEPTIEPSAEPTAEPTTEPVETAEPSPEPTVKATKKPTAQTRKITRNNYLFPSDSAYITMADVNGLSAYDVALIRNEIYARKGYVFKTAEYRNYFNSQAWYKPNPSANKNIVLNSYEKANVDFLKKYEESKGWR